VLFLAADFFAAVFFAAVFRGGDDFFAAAFLAGDEVVFLAVEPELFLAAVVLRAPEPDDEPELPLLEAFAAVFLAPPVRREPLRPDSSPEERRPDRPLEAPRSERSSVDSAPASLLLRSRSRRGPSLMLWSLSRRRPGLLRRL
jgi:hypothetical protein